MTVDCEVAPGADRPSRQHADFGGLSIAWDERVLEPRAWTTEQSRWAASLLRQLPPGRVLELCCGAGQIGLRAVQGSARQLVCVDANPVATSYVVENARTAGLAARVEVRTGWIQEVLEPEERFPLVIADPPWVPHDETAQFPADPTLAIDGGSDGLGVVRTCVQAIERHLAPGGVALLQLGSVEQAQRVGELVQHVVPGDLRVYERGVVLRLDAPPVTDRPSTDT